MSDPTDLRILSEVSPPQSVHVGDTEYHKVVSSLTGRESWAVRISDRLFWTPSSSDDLLDRIAELEAKVGSLTIELDLVDKAGTEFEEERDRYRDAALAAVEELNQWRETPPGRQPGVKVLYARTLLIAALEAGS